MSPRDAPKLAVCRFAVKTAEDEWPVHRPVVGTSYRERIEYHSRELKDRFLLVQALKLNTWSDLPDVMDISVTAPN